jgi:hypothetical protein
MDSSCRSSLHLRDSINRFTSTLYFSIKLHLFLQLIEMGIRVINEDHVGHLLFCFFEYFS